MCCDNVALPWAKGNIAMLSKTVSQNNLFPLQDDHLIFAIPATSFHFSSFASGDLGDGELLVAIQVSQNIRAPDTKLSYSISGQSRAFPTKLQDSRNFLEIPFLSTMCLFCVFLYLW